jgi:transposase
VQKYTYRKVKNSSGNIGVQIGYYKNGNFQVTNHLGTARNPDKLTSLVSEAGKIVSKLNDDTAKQFSLLPQNSTDTRKEFQKRYEHINITHTFAYNELKKYFNKIGYQSIESDLLKDLSLVRIIKPVSKRKSLKLLKDLFDISYSESWLYKSFKTFQSYKRQIQKINTKFAVEELKEDINILFYDVTTLYFESFKSDELKSLGFSKDNKFNQPQLVVGLVTTDSGFPLTYHMYQGKKFEGHTMIPTIQSYLDTVGSDRVTVVADAGMLSSDNISLLAEKEWQYIVGARLSNLKRKYFTKIKNHNFQDKCDLKINTDMGRLITRFSEKRYRKDKHELEKMIKKAKETLKKPSKITARYKYVKKEGKQKYSLNTELIDKRKTLLGLKGYYTNTSYTVEKVVKEYKRLWKIKQNFRVLKNDLACRPIYHWKAENIQGHLLIAFIALSVSKLIEIKKSQSIESFVKEVMKKRDIQLRDLSNDQIFSIQMTKSPTY